MIDGFEDVRFAPLAMTGTLPIALTLALLLLAMHDSSKAQERYALQFKDYSAGPVYDGPKASVRLHRGTGAWKFRTMIRDEYATTPVNFAGRYVAISWGCGTECQAWAVVDARTGAVYLHGAPSAFGAEFHTDSKLFVTDPPPQDPTECDKEQEPDILKAVCRGEYAVYSRWDGHRLVAMKSVADESRSAKRKQRDQSTPAPSGRQERT